MNDRRWDSVSVFSGFPLFFSLSPFLKNTFIENFLGKWDRFYLYLVYISRKAGCHSVSSQYTASYVP